MTQLICDDVRFSCVNTLAKGGKQVVLQTEGGTGGMRAAIAENRFATFAADFHARRAEGDIAPI